MRVLAVLLAAGGGTRFLGPTHKLDSVLGEQSVFAHALQHLMASGLADIAVVTGATEREVPAGVALLHNPHWEHGQATSIRCAIDEAERVGADAVLFGLADQPFIDPAAWQLVAEAPAEWPIVLATYGGTRGPHPVRLHRSVWALVPSSGDDGARLVIRDHPELVHTVECPGSADDIDTLEDLQRWTSS